jgi:NAD(P)-dependent dehydrogenase (short-subunit alcohol dehydrogenase family)
MALRLGGKTAVITGAGSGLGRESAQLFTEEGASLVLLDRVAARVEAVVGEVEDRGGKAVGITGDVGNEADVASAVDAAVDQFGRLDIMFANAGGPPLSLGQTPIFELTKDEWEDVLASNLTGTLWSVKHAARVMRAAGGVILATASSATKTSMPSCTPYTAAKAGVNGLVLAAALELGQYGIRINSINPLLGMSINFMLPRDAPVLGQSYEEALEEDWTPQTAPQPLKLQTRPTLRDVANTVLFLCSDESRYWTGQTVCPSEGGIIYNAAMQFPDGWINMMTARARAHIGVPDIPLTGYQIS